MSNMKNRRDFLRRCAGLASALAIATGDAKPRRPVNLALYGLEHDHAISMMPRLLSHKEVTLVGIIEPNHQLAQRYSDRFGLNPALFFPTLDALRHRVKVEAVAVFTSTFAHVEAVEMCAALGIHVIMEKPMAVNSEHAKRIATAAAHGGIHVLVNYDTSWYPSIQRAIDCVVQERRVGEVHKLVFRIGHSGPGPTTSAEFLSWLTDPRLNGGGVIMDFGCYGADLLSVLMDNALPKSVVAMLQNFQPDRYQKVDDEATIVVSYPNAVGIIQASWNWPIAHKDFDVYGVDGEISVLNPQNLVYRESDARLAAQQSAPSPVQDNYNRDHPMLAAQSTGPLADEYSYLAAVVRGEINPSGPSSLSTNLIVTEILTAARESARSGQRVDL
jgi:predicted dehydrogenase